MDEKLYSKAKGFIDNKGTFEEGCQINEELKSEHKKFFDTKKGSKIGSQPYGMLVNILKRDIKIFEQNNPDIKKKGDSNKGAITTSELNKEAKAKVEVEQKAEPKAKAKAKAKKEKQ